MKNTNSPYALKSVNSQLSSAKKQKANKRLLGDLWFENELCVLFADSNCGKSILSFQIGDNITSKESLGDLKVEANKQAVLYFDFELTDKQIEGRYSDYKFANNFYRIKESDLPKGNGSLMDKVERMIRLNADVVKVIIVDNLTFLDSGITRASVAESIIKRFKALKNELGLSILLIGHSPKRNASKPITQDDLGGSKLLINFSDSAFAIGTVRANEDLKYIKQIKGRVDRKLYGADNVIICDITKTNSRTQFNFIEYGLESELLKTNSDVEKDEVIEEIWRLHHFDMSQRKIAESVGKSVGYVNKILNA